MKYIVILFTIFNFTIASAEDVVLLNKDQPAPFTGFLVTKEKVEKIYHLDLDLQLKTKESEIYKQQLLLTQDQLKRNNEFIDTQSKRIVEMQDNSIFTKIGYFILGSIVTGAIAYGVTTTLR